MLVNATTAARRDGLFAELDILEILNKARPYRIVSSEVLYDYDDFYLFAFSPDAAARGARKQRRSAAVVDLPRHAHEPGGGERAQVQPRRALALQRAAGLDFRFWYAKRPWWDLGMIVLLLGGLVGGSLGLYYGVRRLVR